MKQVDGHRTYIVTVFGGMNSGAFLQAHSLHSYLSGLEECVPCFIDCGARPVVKTVIKRFVKSLTTGQLKKALFWIKRGIKYSDAYGALNSVIFDDLSVTKDDNVVFGSDEIWNIDRPGINQYPIFWGEGISDCNKIAYAPSCSGADLLHSEMVGDFAYNLKKFTHIAVRDSSTSELVGNLLGREIPKVCDPTILFTAEHYKKLEQEYFLDDYVLVYSYGINFTKNEINDIREFARSKGLIIVSADQYLDWCDVSIASGPYGFLGLIDKANYIITDTFHGSVFSAIYHKQFASFARKNDKVLTFLEQYHLKDRNTQGWRSLHACLEASIDYDAFDETANSLREFSTDYLREAILHTVKNTSKSESCDRFHNSAQMIKCEKMVELSKMTTVRIGGKAERLWFPHEGDDLSLLPKNEDGSYNIISGGSNLLISDHHTFNDVISMREYDKEIVSLGEGRFRIGASVRIQQAIKAINGAGYGGIEELISVPGLLGGLICMNASIPSTGTCISNHIESVIAFVDGKTVTYSKEECGFSYRSSRFQDRHHIVLSAVFKFVPQDLSVSSQRIEARRSICQKTQDNSAPNFGSVFSKKSPVIMNAVRRIGIGFNGVRFSKKTSNWLLNNHGTFSDAIRSIRSIERIHSLFGKRIKREVRVWE